MGKKSDALTPEELAAQRGEELPAREVMSIVSTDPVVIDDPSGPYSPDGDSTEPMPTDDGGPPPKDISPPQPVPADDNQSPQPVPPAGGEPQPVPPGTGGPDPYEQSVEADRGPEAS